MISDFVLWHDHRTIVSISLVELLCELVLSLLLNHESDLIIALLDLSQLRLIPPAFIIKLLLLFPGCSKVTRASIDSTLNSEPLLRKTSITR